MSSLKQNHSENNKYTKNVPIKDMHCKSCEILIAEKLKELPNVKNIQVSLKTNSAIIISDRQISDSDISKAIELAGYKVGVESDEKPLITNNKKIWKDIAIGVIVVAIMICIYKILNVDKMLGSATNNSNIGIMALLVGLTAGFSTCMALVGGLVLSVSSKYAESHPKKSASDKFKPHLIFNLGRIISFLFFGAIIGVIGSAFLLNSSILGFITIIVGVVMLTLGLQLTEISPRITRGFSLPSGLAKKLNIISSKYKQYSDNNAFILGAATFFLPCGFTQAMQLLAISTGSPVQAALIMGAFAVGTAPGLLSLGGLTSIIKASFAKRFFRIVGVIVVMMAVVNLSNGYNLMGLNLFFESFKLSGSSQTESNQSSAGSVILNTTFKLDEDISPNTFTARVGQKTTLVVDVKENGQGCMSTIIIIGLNDKPQYLKKDKKIELTFTATKPGEYDIACAMGIYRGVIKVTE